MAQKSLLSLILMVAVVASISSLVSAAPMPDHFKSAKDCSVAVRSGGFVYYTPRYYGNRGRNPADGVTKVVASLPEVACVLEYTKYGVFWVAQKEGDLFRFYKKSDGSLEEVPYAREDCGNPVKGITYPLTKKEVPPATSVQSPPPHKAQQEPATGTPPAVQPAVPAVQARNVCAENGLLGEKFSVGVTQSGEPACFETLSWWESNKTTVVYVVGGVAVAATAYCIATKRCGPHFFGGHGGGTSGGSSGGGGGPVGGGGTGGPSGGGATGGSGPVGGGAMY